MSNGFYDKEAIINGRLNNSKQANLKKGRSLTQDAIARFKSNKIAVFSVFIFIILLLLALFGSMLWKYAEDETFWEFIKSPPTIEGWHIFGFDVNGRDLVARTLSGLGVSLQVAFIATTVSIFIGVSYGAISGYFGGKVDEVMMRFVDIMYALPYILFVILLQVIFGRNILFLYIGIGLLEWITMARIVRGQTLAIKEKEYIDAAKASGRTSMQIIFSHIIPNLIGAVVIYATLTIPEIILTESFLSFIGFGVQEPQTSLGTLISEGADKISSFWWMLLYPAGTLVLLLLSLVFIGEGLRDAFDPKER